MNFKLYFLKHNEYKEKGCDNTCTCTYNITSSNSRIFECDARRLMAWISLRLFTCSKLKIQKYRKCPTFKQTLYMYKMNKGINTEKMLAVWMLSVMPVILGHNTTKPTKWHVHPAKTQISLGCALNEKLRTQAFFMRTGKTLIRLGGCPGWSESSLGAHAILLVL